MFFFTPLLAIKCLLIAFATDGWVAHVVSLTTSNIDCIIIETLISLYENALKMLNIEIEIYFSGSYKK